VSISRVLVEQNDPECIWSWSYQLRLACGLLRSWTTRFPNPLRERVNVSQNQYLSVNCTPVLSQRMACQCCPQCKRNRIHLSTWIKPVPRTSCFSTSPNDQRQRSINDGTFSEDKDAKGCRVEYAVSWVAWAGLSCVAVSLMTRKGEIGMEFHEGRSVGMHWLSGDSVRGGSLEAEAQQRC
jgi:hypothetical protein